MPPVPRRRLRAVAAVSALALVPIGLAACGDDTSSSPSGSVTTATMTMTTAPSTTSAGSGTSTAGGGTTAAKGSAAVTVGSPGEFSIDAPKSVKAGDVTFTVTNKGAAPHEFVILKTDTPAADLTVDGATAKEEGLVDRTDQIAPGQQAALTVSLEKGHYVVLCNLPGHYQGGMHADLTVT